MKRATAILLTSMCMLLVGFAVFMGAFALSLGSGDPLGATITWWAAMLDLMLLVVVVILLICTISLYILNDMDRNDQPPVHSLEQDRVLSREDFEESPDAGFTDE